MRFLARNYFQWSDAVNKLHPRYRLCPTECEDGYNPNRTKKCEDCPEKECDDRFKDETLTIWKQVLGVRAERFRFENVLSSFYKAIRFKDEKPETLTVYQHGIVGVFLSEQSLHRDKQDFKDAENRAANK